jgi:hypothetical protein
VAGDVRQFDLADHSPDYIRGAMYMPYAQAEDTDRQLPAVMDLILRTNGEPTRVVAGIRDLIRQLNPNVPLDQIRTMVSLVNESTQQWRSITWLFVTFAAVALVLAAVGAYGVVSYSTAQRTFEIGVRLRWEPRAEVSSAWCSARACVSCWRVLHWASRPHSR